MATLAAQSFNETGTSLTLSAATVTGDQFINTEKQALLVNNGDATSKTVTVVSQIASFNDSTFGIGVKQNQSVVIPAGGVALLGTFPRGAYNDASGFVQITYSAVTSVQVAVVNV